MEAPVQAGPVTWPLSGKRDVESNCLYVRDIALNINIQIVWFRNRTNRRRAAGWLRMNNIHLTNYLA